MINPNLYRQPVAVDVQQHRTLRLARPVQDWRVAADLNAIFVASAEFGDACSEYPLVFIDAGEDEATGQKTVAPIAVLGLVERQNLFVEGPAWRASYVPAMMRAYPFGIARQDAQRVVLVIDRAYEGWSATEGQPLFDEQGQPSELLAGMRQQLELLETEIQRTRLFGNLLVAEGLLQPMRFDATLPDGRKLSVEGFQTIDEKKLAALPDDKVLALHKNGVLGLIHAHQISLRHMRRLVEWHIARVGADGPAPAEGTGAGAGG
jgi:hypothetical protein